MFDRGHEAAGALIGADLGMAVQVFGRPLCRDDHGRWISPRGWSTAISAQVRVAELVQSGCDLGLSLILVGALSLFDQRGEPRSCSLKNWVFHPLASCHTASPEIVLWLHGVAARDVAHWLAFGAALEQVSPDPRFASE